MTSTLEACALAAPPAAGAAVATVTATASESPVGYIIAVALTLLVVPFVRWLMKREDRRQTFELAQSKRRDKLLALQARTLRDVRRLLHAVVDRLDEHESVRKDVVAELRDTLEALPVNVAKAMKAG